MLSLTSANRQRQISILITHPDVCVFCALAGLDDTDAMAYAQCSDEGLERCFWKGAITLCHIDGCASAA